MVQESKQSLLINFLKENNEMRLRDLYKIFRADMATKTFYFNIRLLYEMGKIDRYEIKGYKYVKFIKNGN